MVSLGLQWVTEQGDQRVLEVLDRVQDLVLEVLEVLDRVLKKVKK